MLGCLENSTKTYSSYNFRLSIHYYHKPKLAVQSSRLFGKHYLEYTPRSVIWGCSLLAREKSTDARGSYNYVGRKSLRQRFQIKAQLEVATAIEVINDLGFDTLTFLAVTVLVVPAFRSIKASPVSPSWTNYLLQHVHILLYEKLSYFMILFL